MECKPSIWWNTIFVIKIIFCLFFIGSVKCSYNELKEGYFLTYIKYRGEPFSIEFLIIHLLIWITLFVCFGRIVGWFLYNNWLEEDMTNKKIVENAINITQETINSTTKKIKKKIENTLVKVKNNIKVDSQKGEENISIICCGMPKYTFWQAFYRSFIWSICCFIFSGYYYFGCPDCILDFMNYKPSEIMEKAVSDHIGIFYMQGTLLVSVIAMMISDGYEYWNIKAVWADSKFTYHHLVVIITTLFGYLADLRCTYLIQLIGPIAEFGSAFFCLNQLMANKFSFWCFVIFMTLTNIAMVWIGWIITFTYNDEIISIKVAWLALVGLAIGRMIPVIHECMCKFKKKNE